MAEKEIPEWQVRQSRTFSKWTNMYMQKKGYETRAGADGQEFADSWSDGVLIMKLMNALYDVKMPRKYKKGAKTRVHKLDNVNQAIKMIDKAEVKTTNLKQVSILDGNFTLMCGMVWNFILDYNIKGISVEDQTAKQGLLIWCQKKTKGYKGLDGKIRNFKGDWKNGNAFLALVDRHTTGMVDYDAQYDQTPAEKCEAAFAACEELGIPRLLDVSDITDFQPDEKAVMTYVSEMFKLFSKEDVKDNAREHIARFLNFQRRIDVLTADYEAAFAEILEWANDKKSHFEGDNLPETLTDANVQTGQFKEYLVNEKPPYMGKIVDTMDLYANIQAELKVNGRGPYQNPNANPEDLTAIVADLNVCEANYIAGVRGAREGFVEKIDINSVSEEQVAEWEKAFETFDADKSGLLEIHEFRACLSAVGIALSESDFDDTFRSVSYEAKVTREQFIAYLTQFFTTSDDANSLIKSLQVLGDPDDFDYETSGLSAEDAEYLQSKAGEEGLAALISQIYQA